MHLERYRMLGMGYKIRARLSAALIHWLTPERLKHYPICILVITLVVYSFSQYFGPGLLDVQGHIIGTDFLAFYTGGKLFLSGSVDRLYDLSAQRSIQMNVDPGLDKHSVYYFINPPFTVLLFALFSMGSYIYGLITWWMAGLIFTYLSIRLIRSEIVSLKKYSNMKLYFMCFLFFPSLCWFMYGQNTALTLFFYVMFYVLLRRAQDLPAGIALGVLLYKPQLIVCFFLVLLFKKRWKAIAGFFLGAGLWVFTGLLLSPQAMYDYSRLAPHFMEVLRLKSDAETLQTYFNLGPSTSHPTWGIHSIFGFSSLLLDNVWKQGANYLYIGLLLGGILYLIRGWSGQAWEPGSKRWDFAMAISFVLGLLISPQLFIYDLMLLLVPLSIVWGHYPDGANGKPLDGGGLLLWSALLYIFCFVGAYVTLAQLLLLPFFGMPAVAIQISTLVMMRWVLELSRTGKIPQNQC